MKTSTLAVVLGLSLAVSAAAQSDFRFLTTSLPDGSTNAVYSATLLVANADGPVTFSISSGSLPDGLTLNSQTGYITGIPTTVQQPEITFQASDGISIISLATSIKISAAGGGGNGGVSFTTTSLPDGRVGSVYSATLTTTGGVGPIVFGAANLPAGLSLNGLTGLIFGTPSEAGTFYVTFTANDPKESNKVVTIVRLLVLPDGSNFQFTTIILDNGQVGTPFNDTLTTSGGEIPPIHYTASGLPPGLELERLTGVISGTPTAAGTFLVALHANDGVSNIFMNLTMWIAPSATSNFYWNFFGLPAAFVNQKYKREPPIAITTLNPAPGAAVSYSSIGFPDGISYNENTGEITGAPLEIGVYPVTLTATSNTGEVLILKFNFDVLPRIGGSVDDIPVNLWVSKQSVRKAVPGKAAWKASYIYNADRRTGHTFNPPAMPASTPAFIVELGAHNLTMNAGSFTVETGKFMIKNVKGSTPTNNVMVDPHVQAITITTSNDTFTDTFLGVFRNAVTLGSKGYALDELFNAVGVFRPPAGYRKTAFVVADAKLNKASGSATFNMLLADPAFVFLPGSAQDFEFSLNIAGTDTVVLDKVFTNLVTGKISTSGASGVTTVRLKSNKDTAAANTLDKFSYDSKTGKLVLNLSHADLSALKTPEVHVGVELMIGTQLYTTAVTIFASPAGSYSTTKP